MTHLRKLPKDRIMVPKPSTDGAKTTCVTLPKGWSAALVPLHEVTIPPEAWDWFCLDGVKASGLAAAKPGLIG